MIPVAEPIIGETELKYVIECVKSGWVSSIGDYIDTFEESFSKFCGTRYGVSCSNGTVALHLALKAIGIGKGDEVIVPALTFIATANAVTYCNAVPVFVDVEPETWNIDPDKIEEKITKNTKAIIPVHIYGHPANMDPILDIAGEHNLLVIEDAAEAHGAKYKGKKVGSIGDVGCFSFYGNKIITTGEGGMITTDNEEIAEKVRMLRDHAMSKEKRYWHDEIGFNYRLTNLQAALGVAQMERIDDIIRIKRSNAKLYNSLLKTVIGITLPKEADWAKSVYWMYSILIEDKYGISRDEFIIKLKERGIDSRPFFYPVPSMPPYKNEEAFPIARDLSKKGINMPSSPLLKKQEVEYITNCIRELSRKHIMKSR